MLKENSTKEVTFEPMPERIEKVNHVMIKGKHISEHVQRSMGKTMPGVVEE